MFCIGFFFGLADDDLYKHLLFTEMLNIFGRFFMAALAKNENSGNKAFASSIRFRIAS